MSVEPMLPSTLHDEQALQDYVREFRRYLRLDVMPGTRQVFEQHVRPRFAKQHGRDFEDYHEVRRMMTRNAYYQFWSAMQRRSQEMMWESVGSSVERQLPELVSKARAAGSRYGTLRLDPDLEVPGYHSAVDIHCQPGGYHTELTEDDVAAGAVYDRAVYLYAMGRMGPFNDDIGASLAQHIRREFPDFAPKRILDLGCSVGHSTVPYVEAFPGAEVHAVEIGAPMLRYAHARAESLGVPIHFSQQNAEAMDFEDESFDLIVSHILLHETSKKAIRRIMAECHRLLRPGGLMLHGEVPQYASMPVFDAFMLDWDTYNNNEPFWGTVHDMDLEELAAGAGFARDRVVQILAPSAFAAAEAKRTHRFQGGDFGGGGQWFAFGAWK